METEWCRVRQFYAGNGYGAVFIPEVGDEVLLAFIHGDMRIPIVLGGLYNGKDKPPTHRSADLDQKMIRTKGGSELLFDDTTGKRRVRITTPGGHKADLSDVDRNITLQSAGGQSVVLNDSAQSITLKSGTATVTIDGTSGRITVDGISVVVSAPSVALGSSAAPHQLVLGELLVAAFNAHTHICTAPLSPSGPPVPPLTPAILSTVTKTI
jgi:uncharacterized protein involved in type VI secretion and phage assembly